MEGKMDAKAQARKELLEQELERYLLVLKEQDEPEKVIVFGSLASGDVHEWSDVDLVIVNETQLPFLERLFQTQDLLQPEVGTDILYYTPEEFTRLCRERSFFREEIVKKGKVVFEKTKQFVQI
jgi:predicted nucleotidyltransferase